MLVPAEILEPPEYRHLHRADCAQVLDGYLRRLARQDTACRRVLGRLADAFLWRDGHHKLGFAKLGDYARERLGISGREFQELAHVARRLAELPAIAGAFDEGAVSWTQVRLLVGVATPETQREWLALARGRTTRALAALIAARGGREPPDDDETVEGEPRIRFTMRCPGRLRSLWRDTVELARRMAGANVAPWQAAEAIAAEGLSAPESVPTPRPPPDTVVRDPDEPPVSCADGVGVGEAIPADVAELVRDLDCDNVFRLDGKLRACLRQMQRIDWQMGRLLRFFIDLRLHRFFGLQSSASYIRERLGMSVRKARALAALERRAGLAPALADAYRDGRISWIQALTLLPVVSEVHGEAWVARAGEVTLRRLVAEVEWALESRCGSPPPLGAALVVPEVQMGAREGEPTDAELRFSGPASVVALFRAAIAGLRRNAEPQWRGLERLLHHAKREWESQPRHRDPIFERDGWRCAVPVCTARTSLHDHHVLYRSRGGEHAWGNRVAICAWHHLRGIHRGIIKVSGQAPDDLVWEIGVRRGRPPLLRTHGECYLTAEAS